MSNLAYSIEPYNFTLTEEERRQLIEITSNADKDYTSNIMCNLSNLNLEQGFINSNILTTQFIPSLNTNEIKISNTNVSNIFTTQTDFNTQINTIVGNIELLNDDLYMALIILFHFLSFQEYYMLKF